MYKLLFSILTASVVAGVAQAQTGSGSVAVPGSACQDGACPKATPQIYACVASTVTRDPLAHGRLLSVIQRLERARDNDSAGAMLRVVEKTGCGVENHWVRVVELKAEIEKTPYLGREVTVTGVLVKDQSENYRIKVPNGQASWIVGPDGVDPRWMGSQVTVRGATSGTSRLKVLNITPN